MADFLLEVPNCRPEQHVDLREQVSLVYANHYFMKLWMLRFSAKSIGGSLALEAGMLELRQERYQRGILIFETAFTRPVYHFEFRYER